MSGGKLPFPYTFISYKGQQRYCLLIITVLSIVHRVVWCWRKYSSMPNLVRNPKIFRGITHSTVLAAGESSPQSHILLLCDPSCHRPIYSMVTEMVHSLQLFRIKYDIHFSFPKRALFLACHLPLFGHPTNISWTVKSVMLLPIEFVSSVVFET
jgi:hypothetical protein